MLLKLQNVLFLKFESNFAQLLSFEKLGRVFICSPFIKILVTLLQYGVIPRGSKIGKCIT